MAAGLASGHISSDWHRRGHEYSVNLPRRPLHTRLQLVKIVRSTTEVLFPIGDVAAKPELILREVRNADL